jgi:hypothetical protein
VTIPDHVIEKHFGLFCRRNLEKEKEASKVLECYEQSVMGNFDGKSKDQNADRNANNTVCTCEVSDGNWTAGYLCYILAKNLSIFYPCRETL